LTLLGSGASDIFSALLNGASLYPIDVQEEGIAHLAGWLIREGITIYHSVATLFRQFVGTLTGAEAFPSLRLIRLQGEPVQWSDVALFQKQFGPGCIFVNSYAITETSLIAQYFIDKDTPIDEGRLPVGLPQEDLEPLLLDEDGQEVPPGDAGEIGVRSRYLASGYWRNPDLTRARFLPDPQDSDSRLYLSGDLGRLLPNGLLLHLGRKDFQVKIRGHRIEPGEIEAALLDLGLVQDAVVVAREEEPGENRLIAYVVPARRGDEAAPLTVSAVRRGLASRLPEAMIPAAFVLMETLPRTVTGKVDRRALPAPSSARPTLDTPFAAPRTPIEEIVAGIWNEVLGLQPVGIYDPFLELGGDSLRAGQVVSRTLQAFGVQLPGRAFLETPTVADMAVLIIRSLAEHTGEEGLPGILAELEANSAEE
jgi:acyl-coenzyme A synthetase/AMP-(fatty) acid ligase/acyl carrier protein